MTFDFYCLKNCDTCRNALNSLKAAGHELNVLDIRADRVPRAVLDDALARLGPATLLSTRSPTWKTLSPAEQAGDLVDLMLEHPTLMKRPLIVGDDWISAGWAKDVAATLVRMGHTP